ncbi:MAG: hypothetical protein IEMM0002_1542 [bacterium]|nr:MAG: hypothetical protein IEMM0002_1542 [bacterium]
MKRRKEGGRIGHHGKKIDVLECANCGCPNAPGASRCMYCRSEMERKSPGFSNAAFYYVNFFKSYFATVVFRFSNSMGNRLGRLLLTSILACVLGATGVFLILRAIDGGGFFYWSVGSLCLAYAVSLSACSYDAFRK